jgi:hypothetical protein
MRQLIERLQERDFRKMMPKVKGWKSLYAAGGFVYSKNLKGGKGGPTLEVTFVEVPDVIEKGKAGGAYIEFVPGRDSQGRWGSELKEMKWKSLDDIKKVLAQADRFAEKKWKEFSG